MTRANHSPAHIRNGSANGHRNGHGHNGHLDHDPTTQHSAQTTVPHQPHLTNLDDAFELDDDLRVTIADRTEHAGSPDRPVNGADMEIGSKPSSNGQTNGHADAPANGYANNHDDDVNARDTLEDVRRRSASRRRPSKAALAEDDATTIAVADADEPALKSANHAVASGKQPARKAPSADHKLTPTANKAPRHVSPEQAQARHDAGAGPTVPPAPVVKPKRPVASDGLSRDAAETVPFEPLSMSHPLIEPEPEFDAEPTPSKSSDVKSDSAPVRPAAVPPQPTRPVPNIVAEDPHPTEITEIREVTDRGRDVTSMPGWVRQPTPNQQSIPSRGELARHLAWHVCPFCGHRNESARHACAKCGRVDTDDTRRATVRRQGPWFLQQPDNPNAPGVRFAVLQEMVRTGEIHSGSVVRGPTTTQLWTFAARVRGLGHLFGLCWKCNRRLLPPEPGETPDDFCIYCGALLEAPGNPDQQLEAVREATPKVGDVNAKPTTPALSAADQPRVSEGQRYRNASRRRPPGSFDDEYTDEFARGSGEAEDFTPLDIEEAPAILDDRGGDGLLSQQELAAVFDLDRRRLGGAMRRGPGVPWGKLLLGFIVVVLVGALAFAVFNYFGTDPGDLTPGVEINPNVLPPAGDL